MPMSTLSWSVRAVMEFSASMIAGSRLLTATLARNTSYSDAAPSSNFFWKISAFSFAVAWFSSITRLLSCASIKA